MHRHDREDQYSYVLEGRVGAVFDDSRTTALVERHNLRFWLALAYAHALEIRRLCPAGLGLGDVGGHA